jgi:hypothetical protein
MSLPASGQISFNDIQTELGMNISGQNGIGDFISYFPSMNQSTPYGMDEFFSQTYYNATTNGGAVSTFGSSTPYTKTGTIVVRGSVTIKFNASSGAGSGNTVTGTLTVNGNTYYQTATALTSPTRANTTSQYISLPAGSYPYTLDRSSSNSTNWTLNFQFQYP